jgi:hypothetical protein
MVNESVTFSLYRLWYSDRLLGSGAGESVSFAGLRITFTKLGLAMGPCLTNFVDVVYWSLSWKTLEMCE